MATMKKVHANKSYKSQSAYAPTTSKTSSPAKPPSSGKGRKQYKGKK